MSRSGKLENVFLIFPKTLFGVTVFFCEGSMGLSSISIRLISWNDMIDVIVIDKHIINEWQQIELSYISDGSIYRGIGPSLIYSDSLCRQDWLRKLKAIKLSLTIFPFFSTIGGCNSEGSHSTSRAIHHGTRKTKKMNEHKKILEQFRAVYIFNFACCRYNCPQLQRSNYATVRTSSLR